MAEKKKKATSKSLVIVESPSKAKTIAKFLGSKYKVVASVGHIRDLPKSKIGIDIENDFEPAYIPIKGKAAVINSMKKEAKTADKVLLATDLDREGEAISWHIAYLLGLNDEEVCRIEFNEITKNAIINAVKNPRKIDKNLVDAQQARRVLDRLVGYQLSPLLWRKVRRGLSAGRVQSAALKIICDREKSILSFVPEEYWTINVLLSTVLQQKKRDEIVQKIREKINNNEEFIAKLSEFKGEKISLKNESEAKEALKGIKKDEYVVAKATQKERIRKPYPPYTTSTLQQDASVRLGLFTKKTMFIAQQLYEGIDIKGEGTMGLITYIRTDSVRISDEARFATKDYINKNFSQKYTSNNIYINKKKDAQDAHEAIRPSDVNKTPEKIRDSLSKEQYNLYKLIWERFVASQMAAAVYDSVTAEIINNDYGFRATGSSLKFDGFLKVYMVTDEETSKLLPPLTEKQNLACQEMENTQKFTQPPSRFTEASLIKELEDKNIGRPSTYAPIVGTLVDREYVLREKKIIIPTDLGFVVTNLIESHFYEIVDAGFTAEMEDKLDDIETLGASWKDVIRDFYKTFSEDLKKAEEAIGHVELPVVLTDEKCELCGKQMAIKRGRFGEFLACSGYPDCKSTKPIVKKINVKCPSCGKDIIARKSKKGKVFYGCSGYPDCTQVYWDKPTNKACPECKALLLEKSGKGSKKLSCSNQECKYQI